MKHKHNAYKEEKANIRCLERGCSFSCTYKEKLQLHLSEQHGIVMEISIKKFENLQGKLYCIKALYKVNRSTSWNSSLRVVLGLCIITIKLVFRKLMLIIKEYREGTVSEWLYQWILVFI